MFRVLQMLAHNSNKQTQKFDVGDQVSFYIPPSKPETIKKSKKGKHLLQYRGPAEITRVRTPTTYDLEYHNRKYSRATSELRPYKSKNVQWAHTEVSRDERTGLQVGHIVAYLAEPGDRKYHLGKVASLGDDLVLDAYATKTAALSAAIWKPLEQITRTEQYTISRQARRHQVQVQDTIPQDAVADLIIATKIELAANGKLTQDARQKLRGTGKTHHRLGRTFP